jgi:hypothetical protein
VVESNRLQSGEPVATVGAAQEDRRLIVDQLAAAVSEDGWPIDQAHPQLLAAHGREPPDSATGWEHGPADRLAAQTRRVGEPQTGADFGGERDREEKVSEERFGKTGTLGLGIPRRRTRPLPWSADAPSTESSGSVSVWSVVAAVSDRRLSIQ